jgi:hypothetical protein
MTQITNEHLYSTAFYYAVGIISGFPYYEDMDVSDIISDILQRAKDIIIAEQGMYETD